MMNEKAQTLIPYITTKCRISSYFAKNKCSNWARTRVVEGKESLWRKVIELADVLYACGFEVRKINRSLFSQFKGKAVMRHETLELVYHLTNSGDSYPQVRLYKGKGKWKTLKFSQLREALEPYAINPNDINDFLWLLSLETTLFRTYNTIGTILEELNIAVREREETT
jgi:hypothetical protein